MQLCHGRVLHPSPVALILPVLARSVAKASKAMHVSGSKCINMSYLAVLLIGQSSTSWVLHILDSNVLQAKQNIVSKALRRVA